MVSKHGAGAELYTWQVYILEVLCNVGVLNRGLRNITLMGR